MTDLRDVIARAAYGAVEEYYAQPNDDMQKSEHDLVADAVIAVLADHDAKVRAQALREARDAINSLRNTPSLITLADRFGGYHQGERAGLEKAEDIITQIEWKEVAGDD